MDSLNFLMPDNINTDNLVPQDNPTGSLLDILQTSGPGPSQPITFDPIKSFQFPSSPTSEAAAAPLFFDAQRTNVDRYTNSAYFKQLGFNPLEGNANEYKYGSMQTWGDTMGNALGGAWKLGANTFIQGWEGWGNMANALTSWDSSKLVGSPEQLYQSNQEQNAIMNKYAIFATPESDAGGVFNRKFFGDMVQQTGFALGTIAQFLSEELITYGLSTEFSLAKLGIKAPSWLGKVVTKSELLADMTKLGENIYKDRTFAEKFVENARKFVPFLETGEEMAKYSKAGAGAAQIAAIGVGGLRRTLAEANMSFTEARMEAANTYGDLYNKLYDEEVDKTGEVPSGDKLARMKEIAMKASSDNFFVNSGILMLSNRLQFDNLLGKFSFGREILGEGGGFAEDILKVTGKVGENETTKVYQKGLMGTPGLYGKIAEDFGKKEAAWQVAKSLGKHAFKWETSEGLQEVFQDLSNQSLQNYYYDLYHGIKGADFSPSLEKAWAQENQGNQGLKTFLMGALTGSLISPIDFAIGRAKTYGMSTAEQRQTREADVKDAVEMLNGFYENPNRYLNEHIANVKLQDHVAKTMDEAIANRDKYVFNNFRDSGFAKMVSAAIKTDMYESVMSTLRNYGESMTDQDFKEAFGMEKNKYNIDSIKGFFDKVASSVEEFHKNWKTLRDRYADSVIPEIYKDGTPEKKISLAAKRALDDAIEILATNSYKGQNAIVRATDLQTQMAATPTIGGSLENAFRILGHAGETAQEAYLLDQEITSLESADKIDRETRKLITAKKKQLAALTDWLKNQDALEKMGIEEKRRFNKARKSFRDYVNSKNEQAKLDVSIKNDDFEDIYKNFLDYIQLNSDAKQYVDAYNVLANPTKFILMHERMLDAILKTEETYKKEHEAEIKGEKPEAEEKTGSLADLMEKGLTVDEANPEKVEKEEAEKKNVDKQALETELHDAYRTYAQEAYEQGNTPAKPSEWIRFGETARKILTKYGATKEDIYHNINNVTEDNYNDISFSYGEPIAAAQPAPLETTEDQTAGGTNIEQVDPTAAETPAEQAVTTELPDNVIAGMDTGAQQNQGASQSVVIGKQTINVGDRITGNPGGDLTVTGINSKGDVTLANDETQVTLPKDDLAQLMANGYSQIVKAATKTTGKATPKKTTAPVVKKPTFENGEINNVEQTRAAMLNQANKKGGVDDQLEKETPGVVEGKKVINGATKINNRTEDFTATTDNKGKTIRQITGVNSNYPMIMATSRINMGTGITLRVDTSLANYDEYEYINTNNVTKRSKEDFFENGKVKQSAVESFPIAIYTNYNGQEVKLGYLPTVEWVNAKYPNGSTVNVVDKTYDKDGNEQDNLGPNLAQLRKIRQDLMNGFNTAGKTEWTAIVDNKSDGNLRTISGVNKVADVVSPGTQIGIIKNGVVYTGKNVEATGQIILPSEVSTTIENKNTEGWPVVLINTPTGKRLASWVSVPTLNKEHQDLILNAWSAFHLLNNNAKANEPHDTKSKAYEIASAIYEAYGAKLAVDEQPNFKLLQDYVNDYITFTGGKNDEKNGYKKYDPLKPGSSLLTILPNGTLITWVVQTGVEANDKVLMTDPSRLTDENKNKFYNLADQVHYNIKFSDKNNNGINSDSKMRFLSMVGDSLIKSEPMTYNEHVSNLLETNIEPGIPLDPKQPDGERVYFSNPVLNFSFTEPTETKVTTQKENAAVPAETTLVTTNIESKKADIERRRQEHIDLIEHNENADGSEESQAYDTSWSKKNEYEYFSGKTKKEVVNKINAKYDAELAALEGGKTKTVKSLADELLNMDFGEGLTDFGNFDQGVIDGDLPGDKKSIATKVNDIVNDKEIDKNCNG